jgi:hypothetical protein
MNKRIRKALTVVTSVGVLLSIYSIPVQAATTINVSSAAGLKTALANAKPGHEIVLAPGTYTGIFTANSNGNASNRIVLRSQSATNPAILSGPSINSDYELHVTGDYWTVKNVKIRNSAKGIVLDNSNNTILDGVEVYDIGAEGVHFRDGSSNGTIQNSYIHDTGKTAPGYGEGVYIGTAEKDWGKYNKATDNNTIRNVKIGPNVRGESIDIKEGTTGTLIENNTFNGIGISNVHVDDSFIDVKGKNVIIRNNTGYRNNNSKIVDAIQIHKIVTGYGVNIQITNNTFHLDNSSAYVVNASGGTSATVSGNKRLPAGNMYKGNITVK